MLEVNHTYCELGNKVYQQAFGIFTEMLQSIFPDNTINSNYSTKILAFKPLKLFPKFFVVPARFSSMHAIKLCRKLEYAVAHVWLPYCCVTNEQASFLLSLFSIVLKSLKCNDRLEFRRTTL